MGLFEVTFYMKLALKITPQRSTQYANMVTTLAAPELLASPLGKFISECKPVTLAGQAYLIVTFLEEVSLSPYLLSVLPRLAATSEAYEYFDEIGTVSGPLLRPIEPQFVPFVPLEMAEARRYKGKTNEVFTRVLLNVALFAGAYADSMGERLRILDPLAGGGTTLFLALNDGYDAFGIELDKQDVETTAVFVRQYLESIHKHYKERDERGRRAGRRIQFEIGRKGGDTRLLVLVNGDATQADVHMREVMGGPHVHAIVGDLPYGIQHFGEISSLLTHALPIWTNTLLPGGTIALAWNATRVERAEMVNFLEQEAGLVVRNEPPYTEFTHTVDRVIKRRDIIVGVKKIT